MLYSLLLATEGRTQDMAVKVTHARIEVSKKDMLKEMDYRNENIAIIMNKYGESALDLMKNPPKEVLALVEKHVRPNGRLPEKPSASDSKKK